MTVLIIAILNGRTNEEWCAWVSDRVKQKYGYETPGSVPQLYGQARFDEVQRTASKTGRESSGAFFIREFRFTGRIL